MLYDPQDTIAAIASAGGGGGRGIVRLSGLAAADCLARCFEPDDASELSSQFEGRKGPRRIAGVVRCLPASNSDPPIRVPGELILWPGSRSYARQPSGEFHTLGSPPLLAAVVEQFCRSGARPAGPGEFTLRAFLAGRIDLTQAEAVLGVVDARGDADLQAALVQLAGGLARPLATLRADLLNLLAELEAGLDFADEQVQFVGRDELVQRLSHAREMVVGRATNLATRGRSDTPPRVVIAGPTNAGKSSLFNALVARFGVRQPAAEAIVSPTPGATRDFVTAIAAFGGVICELVDAAGDDAAAAGSVERAAQQAAGQQRRHADLRLHCRDATLPAPDRASDMASATSMGECRDQSRLGPSRRADLEVVLKIDLLSPASHARLQRRHAASALCSAVSGAGLNELGDIVAARLEQLADDGSTGAMAAAAAARSGESFRHADRALTAALALVGADREELLAAEIRAALAALGEVAGATSADDVLDRIFSKFCIGK